MSYINEPCQFGILDLLNSSAVFLFVITAHYVSVEGQKSQLNSFKSKSTVYYNSVQELNGFEYFLNPL